MLVSYLPKLKAKDNITKNFESFWKLQKQVFQECLGILLLLILNKNDMYFIVKNEIHLFTPKISIILTNMVKIVIFTTTYFLSISKWPYYFCLINNKDFNNMVLTHVDLWTLEEMKKITDIN